MNTRLLALGFVGLAVLLIATVPAHAQTSEFTYQGKLNDGPIPASGLYDFTFSLFDSSSGSNQIGNTSTNTAVTVTTGVFSVALDFGSNFPGAERWLEIGVRTNGSDSFTVLSPRQKVTATPYALTAANLSGPLSTAQWGSLTNHNDVSVQALAAGQVLIHNGAAWTNVLLAANTQFAPPVTLGFNATNVAVNAALGAHFRLVATNNFLLQNPTGAIDGQRLIFELIQDNSGGRTISLGTAFRLSLDLPVINLTTNANGRDFLTCIASGTNFYVVGFMKGF